MSFGNFETPGSTKDKERKEGSDAEKMPHPSSWKERFKYYAKVATIIGATSVFAVQDIGNMAEQQYKKHLDESLNKEEKEYVDSMYSRIRSQVGDRAVQEIKEGDKAAYANENVPPLKDRQPPSFYGFDEADVDQELLEHMLSEDFFFPKNWIRGEIDQITYNDKVIENSKGQTEASYLKPENAVLFFRKHSESSQEKPSVWFYKHRFAHESAHANDWGTDQDLDIVERAELLVSVLDRLQSENPYESPGSGNSEYYRTHLEGTKAGKREAAREYWAEICKMYFSGPEYLKENHPKDFQLVDEYVKKQDPDFDPFASGGPYFDGQTGEILPKWKDYIEKQLPKN